MPPSPIRAPRVSRRDALRTGAALAAGIGSAGLLGACGRIHADGESPDGTVRVVVWHGQESSAKKAFQDLARDFNRTHPGIRVVSGGEGVIPDNMLRKVTAGLAAGDYPDIAYVYGSDLASLAGSTRITDLSRVLKEESPTPWQDYWVSAREAVTVGGRILGAPALLDSLCVVYNKKMFRDAGILYPEDGWTWDDFTEIAKQLTDRRRGVHGTGWPACGDEDTVWRLWPMIWDQGGDVVTPDEKTIAFVTPGELALETLARMVGDRSVYVDPRPGAQRMYELFVEGRMSMVLTGPWMLPDIREGKVDYGVVKLPSYSGISVTISGPDTWAVFDNGAARRRAATRFISWLVQPEQDVRWDVSVGSLPLSGTASRLPAWRRETRNTEGLDVFVDALDSARVRPVTAVYPDISRHLGEAITSVLLGKKDPAGAMEACTRRSNAALKAART